MMSLTVLGNVFPIDRSMTALPGMTPGVVLRICKAASCDFPASELASVRSWSALQGHSASPAAIHWSVTRVAVVLTTFGQ